MNQMRRRAHALLAACLFASALPAALAAPPSGGGGGCGNIALPAPGEYGAQGPYATTEEHVRSPLWPEKEVVVFRPANVDRKVPVLFYSHAFGQTEYQPYVEMFTHFASRGYVVVYSPYQKFGASTEKRYDTLWAGFEAAVSSFGNYMDLGRVGFIGHSFGGGATPSMAYRALTQKGWGNKAAFMYIMAPWYSYEISVDQLRNFPRHVRMIMQVYDRDTTNDHRMAIDIFRNIGLPESQKNFVMLNSQSRMGCELIADHATPRDDAPAPLRYYGIYRLVDALAALSFENQAAAADIALGGGSRAQVFMGRWPDNADIAFAQTSTSPVPIQPESYYRFAWNDRKNPRLGSGDQAEGSDGPQRRHLLRRLLGRE